jgi:hypothetical protein
MPDGREYKPGDLVTFNNSPYVAGEDGLWHPQTSFSGQAAQGAAVDLPAGLAGLVDLATKYGSPYPNSGTNIAEPVRNSAESGLSALGVNITPPQTRGQRYVRAAGQIPGQVGLAYATGGASAARGLAGLAAETAGATGGTLAAQTMQEAGGGGISQFGAGAVGDLIARRPPMKTVSLVRDISHDIYNARNIRAFKLIQPMDLADEGAAKVLSEINIQHARRATAMESAYSRVKTLSQYPVSAVRLRDAAKAMLDEVAGNSKSDLLAKSMYDRIMDIVNKGQGSVNLKTLRVLQKEANAILDTADPARTGLAQQQGQVRSMVIPAIQQTLDDMVAVGQSQLKTHPNRGAIAMQQDVQNLRAANKLASEYYSLFDKRSTVTKAMVEGIQGGAMLDPRKALEKVFRDPKDAVEHARAIMQIIGVNPRNESVMRKALVESVIGENLDTFSATKSLADMRKIAPAAREILTPQGYAQFERFLQVAKKHQTKPSMARAAGTGVVLGASLGAMTGHNPFLFGNLGAFLGAASSKTFEYIDGHFGEGAAYHLATESITDPQVFAMLHANPRRLGQAQLDRAIGRALIRSGFRASTSQNFQPMLPSEQGQPRHQDLERFRRPQ